MPGPVSFLWSDGKVGGAQTVVASPSWLKRPMNEVTTENNGVGTIETV